MRFAVLEWTGIARLVSFYRFLAFSGPRVVAASGVVLLLGMAAIRLYWLLGSFVVPSYPAYVAAYFAVLAAAAALAAALLVTPRRSVAMAGWTLGGMVAAASLAMYIISRTIGLPYLPGVVGRWDYAVGTVAIALSALFLALHFSVLTGMNVAYPQRRLWRD